MKTEHVEYRSDISDFDSLDDIPFDDGLEFDPHTARYRETRPRREPSLISRRVLGTVPTRIEEARKRQDLVLRGSDRGLQWGSFRIPSWPLPSFAIFGLTGTGKTTVLRLLCQDLVANIGARSAARPARCLVYDPKRDLLQHIVSLHQNPELVVFTNPLDARSSPWDLAADFTSPTYAEELAKLIVPLSTREDESDRSFYPKTVRLILQGIFQSFISTCPEQWKLRDVILATEDLEDLLHLFKRGAPHTARALSQLEQVKDTYGNLLISIYEKLYPYRILAALWHNSEKKPYSLKDWMKNPKTLLLGLSTDQRSLVRRLNRLLFNRASQLVLSQSEDPRVSTYFILDELGRAGNLEELPYVLAEGRSRNVSAMLATQGIELLQKVYGREVCEDLLSHCQNRAYLGLSPETARWAANQIGKAEHVDESISVGTSHKPGVPSNNRTLQRHERYAVRPEEFMNRPKPRLDPDIPLWGTFVSDPLHGFGIVPNDEMPARTLFTELLKKSQEHPDFIERSLTDQELPPWSNEDRERLGLPARSPPKRPVDPFEFFMNHRF